MIRAVRNKIVGS